MPVDYKHKLLFIHVPKCLGTSIEHALDLMHPENFWSHDKLEPYDVVPQHLYASELCSMLSNPDHYIKFSIVRNPYTRLYSEYVYNRMEEVLFQQRALTQTFPEFVDYIFAMKVAHRRFLFDRHIELQSDFIDLEGVKTFKFENPSEVFDWLNVPMLHKRSGNIIDYSSVYTPELKDKVYKFYEKDFIRFGYSFNSI